MFCSVVSCAEYVPCQVHPLGFKHRLQTPGVLAPKALYETIKSAPTITRARFESSSRVRAEFNQLDFSLATTDEKDRIPCEKKFSLELEVRGSRPRPCPIDNSVLLTVHDDTDSTFVVFKKHKESALVEVWDETGLIRTWNYGTTVDKQDFGPPLTDTYMGNAQIHDKQLVFVADEKVNPKGFWHGDETQFLQRADWGESFKGRHSPRVVVLDLNTGNYRVCGKKGSTLMQPVWLSAAEIVCVKVKGGFKLGLNACFQRRTSIVLLNLLDNTSRKLTSHKHLAEDQKQASLNLDFSCRSPRIRPGTREIFYLAREAMGSHQFAFRLRSIHADSLQKSTLVDIVDTPVNKIFPGLYAGNIPPRCFVTPDCLLLSSQWGLQPSVLVFNVLTHQLARLTPPSFGDKLAACSLLDVAERRILLSCSTPNAPSEIWAVSLDETDSIGSRWEQYYRSPLDLTHLFSAECLDVPTADKVGAASTESLLLRPLYSSPNKLERSPVVLFIHGGPHSATSSDFGELTSPVLLACEGYTVVCTNYRGSTGYGEAALKSLPGLIGSRDVQDVVSALDAVLMLPQTSSALGVSLAPDPSRVAVFGGSHGGFLSAHLTTDPSRRFKAAVMRNPVTDFTTLLGTSDIEDWTAFEVGVGTESERIECAGGKGLAAFSKGLSSADMDMLWQRSPMKNVAAVSTPTLLLLGTDDLRVPPSQGRQWGRQLVQRGVLCTTYEYPENGHALSTAFAQAHGNVAALLFLRTHL